jgi:uroporphyrinogen-III synthase
VEQLRIVITASLGRLSGVEEGLTTLGYEVERMPLLTTESISDPAAARGLLAERWRAYPSVPAVTAWCAQGLAFDDGALLAAVGPATAAAIERAGGRVAVAGSGAAATGEGLATALLAASDGPRRGESVGWVAGDRGGDGFARTLAAAGVAAVRVVLYRSLTLPWRAAAPADAVVVASPAAVAALPDEVLAAARIIAIGATTGAALRRRGVAARCAAEPTPAGVIAAVTAALAAGG